MAETCPPGRPPLLKNPTGNVANEFVLQDGSKYDGDFKDDNMHGRGIYTWSDGRRYDGDYKDNKKHDRGCMVYPDGHKEDHIW